MPALSRGRRWRAPRRAGKRLKLSTRKLRRADVPKGHACGSSQESRSGAKHSLTRRPCARRLRTIPARLTPESSEEARPAGAISETGGKRRGRHRTSHRRSPVASPATFQNFRPVHGASQTNCPRPARLARHRKKTPAGQDPASIAECVSKREETPGAPTDAGDQPPARPLCLSREARAQTLT